MFRVIRLRHHMAELGVAVGPADVFWGTSTPSSHDTGLVPIRADHHYVVLPAIASWDGMAPWAAPDDARACKAGRSPAFPLARVNWARPPG